MDPFCAMYETVWVNQESNNILVEQFTLIVENKTQKERESNNPAIDAI
jgi:hypothetical protein